ncbi:MAG: hypothetical protein Q4D53_05475 [Leptotrichiaceae bacterium]|nr:hypothetical protein [Leptotrichiaceae bacterium]
MKENAETSEDFFELAMEADDETTALKLAKKALKLDPDNLDAGLMIAEFSAVDQVDLMERMEKFLKDAHRIMKEKGYMTQENIGDFWLIIETRPYMK